MAAADEQYGNKGYGQIGSYGGNPYDERDQSPAGDRYNNFSQGRYDERTSFSLP
jgi:syntaxin 1B/2/3